jgi:DNA-directed RNA polymerase subunit L
MLKNLKISSIAPKLLIKDKELESLLPTVLIPQRVEFELHSVDQSIANGIRRVIASEYPVLVMNFNKTDFDTDDPFIKYDFIADRVRCVPIDQSIDENVTFSLSANNTTTMPFKVKTGSLESSKTKKYMNETITIASLFPNKYIKIDNIHLKRGYGYEHGCYTMGVNTVCLPIDQEPMNNETNKGIRSTMSNPMSNKIGFNTNGTQDPKKIIVVAINELINRLNGAEQYIPEITKIGDVYQYTISGETDTIGNIIVRNIFAAYKDIDACTYAPIPNTRKVIIKIKTSLDPGSIIKTAIKNATKTLKSILDSTKF